MRRWEERDKRGQRGGVARCDAREQCLVVEVEDVDEVLKDAEDLWGIRGNVFSCSWYLKVE